MFFLEIEFFIRSLRYYYYYYRYFSHTSDATHDLKLELIQEISLSGELQLSLGYNKFCSDGKSSANRVEPCVWLPALIWNVWNEYLFVTSGLNPSEWRYALCLYNRLQLQLVAQLRLRPHKKWFVCWDRRTANDCNGWLRLPSLASHCLSNATWLHLPAHRHHWHHWHSPSPKRSLLINSTRYLRSHIHKSSHQEVSHREQSSGEQSSWVPIPHFILEFTSFTVFISVWKRFICLAHIFVAHK